MGGIRDFEHAGWQAAAPAYARSFTPATGQFVDVLLDAVSAGAGMAILDVACGPGIVSARAAQRGAKPVGIDFSSAMIDLAKAAYPALDFRVADAEHLPFADGGFAAVTVNFGLHHMEHPQRALAEIRRVLRPHGRLAYSKWVAQRDNPPYRAILDAVAEHGTMDVPMPAGQDANLGIDELNRMARDAGFTLDAAEPTPTERLWRLPGGTDLIEVFEAATARMATLLRGQDAQAIKAIRAEVAQAVRRYEHHGTIEIPVRAFIVAATAAT